MATTTASKSWHGFQSAELPSVPSWVKTLGRLGHIAKGIVYFIIGSLAFKLAIGAGGEIAGARGAVREIGQQPYGRILLGIVALGLLSYTAWRWVQAVMDTDGAGTEAKGLILRTGFVISGISYLFLGLFAGSLAIGLAGQSDGEGGKSWLLGTTGGQVMLGIAGAIVFTLGLFFIYKGYQGKFMEKYDLTKMSGNVKTAALHVGRLGLITRGIAVGIIGGFLINSAVLGTGDGEISGMSDALAAIAAQSYGKVLLGVTGFGLMCFAVHMLLMGWYRQFNVQSGA